MLNETSTSTA